jgi:hypothetical protein
VFGIGISQIRIYCKKLFKNLYFPMKLKISMFFLATMMLAIFACKNDTVKVTGKPIGDEKSEKLQPGMPIYDNMQGSWVDHSNPNRKIDIRGGQFKVVENGQVKSEAEFVFYKACPTGCFPEGLTGTTPCFSLRSNGELHCYILQGLQQAKSFAFAEITKDSLITQSFDWSGN